MKGTSCASLVSFSCSLQRPGLRGLRGLGLLALGMVALAAGPVDLLDVRCFLQGKG